MEAVVLSLSLLANVMDFACSSAKCARAPSTSFSSAPFYFNMVVHCILYILQQSLSLSGVCRELFSFGTSDGRSARLASSSRDGNGPRHARANFMVLKNHALHESAPKAASRAGSLLALVLAVRAPHLGTLLVALAILVNILLLANALQKGGDRHTAKRSDYPQQRAHGLGCWYWRWDFLSERTAQHVSHTSPPPP